VKLSAVLKLEASFRVVKLFDDQILLEEARELVSGDPNKFLA
jgi:hypothetical protein